MSWRRRGHLEVQADGAQRELLLPVMQVIRVEEIAGGPLLLAAITALIWSNLAPAAYEAAWRLPVSFDVAGLAWRHDLHHLINDVLLPLFFFVAGLELKRELLELRRALRADPSSATAAAAAPVKEMLRKLGSPNPDWDVDLP